VASIPYSSQYIYQPDKNINKETWELNCAVDQMVIKDM
jgi:hypothetical protein